MLQIVGMRINFTDMRSNQYFWWWVEAKRLHKKWAFLSICGSHLSSVDSGWKASYYSGLPNWLLLPGDNTTSARSSTYNTNPSVSIVANSVRGTMNLPGNWFFSLSFWLVDCKFGPSVSDAFISYKFSHQMTPHAFPSGITCISCQCGHQMGILALVTHLATRWIHFASDLCNFALHSFCNKSSKFSPKKGGSCFFQQWVWGCSSLILSGPGAGVTLQLTLVPG